MKKLLVFIFLLYGFYSYSQILKAYDPDSNGLFISPQIGLDIKTIYDNHTPYINYKGGYNFGVSLDYYWNWFGVGADFNVLKNKPENVFKTDNLYLQSGDKLNLLLINDDIIKSFAGIGPSFRYRYEDFVAELNLRAGFGSIDGGKLLLQKVDDKSMIVNYHAGYKHKGFAGKAQLRFTYFITNNIGLQFGTYYLLHYKSVELSKDGLYSVYWTTIKDNERNILDNKFERRQKCNCNVSSLGIFVGLVYHFNISGGGSTGNGGGSSEKTFYSTYTIVVHARDKITHKALQNIDVVLKDANGKIIKKGKTNQSGAVVFRGIKPGNYNISGVFYDIDLEKSSVSKSEFNTSKTIRKTLLYNYDDMILQGKVLECNTVHGLSEIEVFLKDIDNGKVSKIKTNEKGDFWFRLSKGHKYEIYAKKKDYFSGIKQIDTKKFNRKKQLFVKLNICMEDAGCGKLITLKNIHYDLDKYFIREDAKPELNRLVRFMKDNPKVNVEISSHTDSRASKKYNKILSQNRAKAAVDYIVSQGIDRNRLSAIGYGESRLLNKCSDGVKCTEEEHQLNRRTEMKVICGD